MMLTAGGQGAEGAGWTSRESEPAGGLAAAGPGPFAVPDAFTALGLPRRFDLSPAEIQHAYVAASVPAHPDRAEAGAPASAVELVAARLNAAKRTLEDPERRAVALLALLDGAGAASDRSLPEGFLMTMMELREAAEASAARGGAGDRTPDVIAMDALLNRAGALRAGHVTRVAGLFASLLGPGGAGVEGDQATRRGLLSDLRRELNAWRYIERMLDQLDAPQEGPV